MTDETKPTAKLFALPAIPAGDLAEPDWSAFMPLLEDCEIASEAWRTAVTEMRAVGTLSPANGNQLLRYAVACTLYRKAVAQVFFDGPVIDRSGGQLPAWNLWASAMRDNASLCETLEAELGISPRRRSSVTPAKRTAKKTTAADRYLGTKG